MPDDAMLDLSLSDSDEETRGRRLRRTKRDADTQLRNRRTRQRAARVVLDSSSSSSAENGGNNSEYDSDPDPDFDDEVSNRPGSASIAQLKRSSPLIGSNSGDAAVVDNSVPRTIDLLAIENEPADVGMTCNRGLEPRGSSLSIESVHICGFKNFRDHTEVGPFSAFTCVVGPNGAGKSSILDAVSFVFGGKTSDLRGSNLSNLVNEELLQRNVQNGSKGATITAMVTVSMQAANRDIAVGRRIIIPNARQLSHARSEYTLDGKKQSRTEIGKLLAEYGINIDMQSRFILLQSRTVNIIRQGPVQLLTYLEEIVGTLQIRAEIEQLRQQESSHQLQLDEIQAEIADVASTREGLKPKVKAFEIYTSISAEYLCRRTAHLLKREIVTAYQIERAKGVREDCEKQQTVDDDKLSKFTDDLRSKKALLTKAKRNAGHAQRRLAKIEEAEQECKCETRKLVVQRRRAQKTETEAREMLMTANEKVSELRAIEESLCIAAASLSSTISALSDQIGSKQVPESSLNGEERQELKCLRSSVVKFQQQIKESNEGQLTAQLSQSNDRCTELDEALRAEDQNHENLVRAQLEARTLLDTGLSTEGDANVAEKRLQQELIALQREAKQAATSVSRLQQSSQNSRASRYRAAVLQLSHENPGIHGLLCDLGGCQHQHEAAVNSVLYGTLGATVVVDSRRDGIHVTNHFREHRIGFVSCSILSETKQLPFPTVAEKIQQSNATQLTNLADVIQCLPVYKQLWRRLCAGWCIATDQPTAVQFSKQCNVVTAVGLIFKRDGEMRGSSYPRRQGQHDINALMVSATSLQRSSLHDAGPTSSGDIPTQLAEAEAAFKAIETKLNEKRTETITAVAKSRQAASQKNQAKATLVRLEAQLATSNAALAETKKEQQRVKQIGNQLQEALVEAQRAVEASEKIERQIERLLCSGDLVELHALREQVDSKSTALQEQNKEIQRVQAALRSLQKDVTKHEKKQMTTSQKLDSLRGNLSKLEAVQADASRSKLDAVKQQSDADVEASALEIVVQEQQKKLRALQTDCAAHRRVLEDAQREEKHLRSQHCVTAQELEKTYDDIADSLASVQVAAEAHAELQLGQTETDDTPLQLATVAAQQVTCLLDEGEEDELTSQMKEEQEAVAVLAKQRKEAWKRVDMQAVEEDHRLQTHEQSLTGKQNDAYQMMVRLCHRHNLNNYEARCFCHRALPHL